MPSCAVFCPSWHISLGHFCACYRWTTWLLFLSKQKWREFSGMHLSQVPAAYKELCWWIGSISFMVYLQKSRSSNSLPYPAVFHVCATLLVAATATKIQSVWVLFMEEPRIESCPSVPHQQFCNFTSQGILHTQHRRLFQPLLQHADPTHCPSPTSLVHPRQSKSHSGNSSKSRPTQRQKAWTHTRRSYLVFSIVLQPNT